MNKFLNSLGNVSTYKETENGAFALNSTMNKSLDLFGTIGALRNRSDDEIVSMFLEAYGEDQLLALKMLFYTRDCRGGLGERNTFRVIAKYLATNHSADMKVNLWAVPFYGRWDDLYLFEGTPLEKDAFGFMKNQIDFDLENAKSNKSISGCAKWLKSVNATSKETCRLGRLTAKYFGMSEKTYRKTLSQLRSYANVVETEMSANKWAQIAYDKVPSYAAKNYRNAFIKHDEDRYNKFLASVEVGEKNINAGTLFPYDIIREYTCQPVFKLNKTAELQWKALPDYVADSKKKFLVMADTSASMIGLPRDTAVSLAIYFAERNTGDFHGKFITFTDSPRFVDIQDDLSLCDKTKIVMDDKYVGYSTNLEAAFNLVLRSAIFGDVPAEDMPDAILVISDMEINSFSDEEEELSFTETMKRKFADAGYSMPTLVYWNVNARANTFHGNANDDIRFISGSSATIFKSLCDHMGDSAKDLMLATLNSDRYSNIRKDGDE